mgnify:CR=1 FL=1
MEYLMVIFGYLVGSIPCGLVVGRIAGIDVRASVLPMFVASWLLTDSAIVWVYATGGAAFLGHLYPLYLKFRGGKGVASALGVFMYIQPVAVVFCLVLFVCIVKISGYVSLGSLLASALMPVFVWFLDGIGPAFYLALFVAVFIWLKHHENIHRLLNHEENSLKKR